MTLNPMNAIMAKRLAEALVAIDHLNAAGATVYNVSIRGAQPQLLIDRMPSQFTSHATKSRRQVSPGVIQFEFVASVMGCIVTWIDTAPVAPRAAVPA